jgi:hypothetical protein
MKFDWQNWNTGGKIIFSAARAAVLSIFMTWVEFAFISQNGLAQEAWIFLGLWIYPVLMLFKGKSINRGWGLTCSIVSTVITFIYIQEHTKFLVADTPKNTYGGGAVVFLLASIALIVGVVRYTSSTTDLP